MDLGMKGKVVLVTGATRGIGAAVAKAFFDEGASVFGTGRSGGSVERASKGGVGTGGRIVFGILDLADPQGPARVVEEVLETFERLDFVVNNAASFAYRSLADLGPSDWMELTQQKLVGYSGFIQASQEQLIANHGAVVNISGIAGCVPTGETPHVGAVNSGIVSMTRFYAAHLARHGVRVNAISPGDTDTDRRQERLSRLEEGGLSRSEAELRLAASIPLGRAVSPAEVAGVALALCSPQFAPVTGINVIVDGGRHIHYSAAS